jgi:hypothetical protein
MTSIATAARMMKCFVRKPLSIYRISPTVATRIFSTTTEGISSASSDATSSDFQQSRAAYHQSEEEALQYVSPYQDLFDRMHKNGPTTLGTTEEYLEFEKNQPVKKMQCGMAEHVLRFTTTSYGRTLAAPHVMPNEHRVIAKVHTKYLPLNDLEMEILREIVGDRLNDERNELRLTSNQFGSRIENKRHLVSMMDRIILSCQRLGRELQEEQTKPSEGADQETVQ